MSTMYSISDRFRPSWLADAEQLTFALETGLTGTSNAAVAFESALKEWFDAPEAVAVSSGSSAVMTAVSAFGLKAGDEVLVAPTVPLCTVFPLLALRITPVFCDIRPNSFGLDLEDASHCMSGRTRAIIDVPMWGYPTAADEVAEFAGARKIQFLLDSAHGHGLRLRGRHMWTYADAATFSTHSSKIMATGEGGFIISSRADTAEACRLYSRFGNLNGEHFGMNHKLGGLQAALGISRLQRLRSDISHRLANMRTISARLCNRALEPLPICDGGEANGLALIVRERSGRGGALVAHLGQARVPSDIRKYHCKPLYEFPVLQAYRRRCPNAERMLGAITTIPTHPDLTEDQIDRIVDALNTYR